MSDITCYRWLLRLCDPEGYGDLPYVTLSGRQAANLLLLAESHGVAGTVARNMKAVLHGEGPERLLARRADMGALRDMFETVDRKSLGEVGITLLLRERARQVIEAMHDAGFPVAIVKGEDFADRLYPQPHLRLFRDIDLMMPRSVIDLVEPVMTSLGFHFVKPEGKYNSDYGERTWDGSTRPLTRVELHWNMITCPSQRVTSSLAYDEIQWAPTRGGIQATPDSMLLIAAVHASISHRFDRLQHLCDIRQLCRGRAGALNAELLHDTAKRLGLRSALAVALQVTAKLLKEPACTQLLERLPRTSLSPVWRLLVSERSLLMPERRFSKLRRSVIREWLKHVS